jgi:hypothetical protein
VLSIRLELGIQMEKEELKEGKVNPTVRR